MKQKLTAIASFTEFCLYFCVEWLKRFGYWGHSANTSRLKGNQNILVLLLFLTNTVLQILFFSIFLNLLKGWDPRLKYTQIFWELLNQHHKHSKELSGDHSSVWPSISSPTQGHLSNMWHTHAELKWYSAPPGHFKKLVHPPFKNTKLHYFKCSSSKLILFSPSRLHYLYAEYLDKLDKTLLFFSSLKKGAVHPLFDMGVLCFISI